jgi:hypothetical protein
LGARWRATRWRALGALLWLPLATACGSVDPKTVLEVQNVEGYWVLDAVKSTTNYITPTVHFDVKNTSGEPLRDIEITATFRRKGEESLWGDAFLGVANRNNPLPAGASRGVEMRSSGDYYTPGARVDPEIMFKHGLFRDATVEIFVRTGRSQFVKMASLEIPRRLNRNPSP